MNFSADSYNLSIFTKNIDNMKSAIKLMPAVLAAMITAGCASCGDNGGCTSRNGITTPVIKSIMDRRSIRAYKPVPVGRDTMQVILECGVNAPNAMNSQNWEVRVLDNADEIAAITRLFAAEHPDMAGRPGFVNMFRNAPTVAFVANKKDSGMSQIDCGLLGENMMLAAESLGIGTCCLGGPVAFLKTDAGKDFMERLDFSDGYELLYAIAFGYPDEAPAAKPRDLTKFRFID